MRKTIDHAINLLVVVLLLSARLFAQGPSSTDLGNFTKPVDILPPSPNAASLGKYGGVDISPATGTVNFTIPIFDYQSSNLKLPLSLSYASDGLKVDEIASRVGTSWSLNAGGVITRTVYGNLDEETQRLAPPTGFPNRTKASLDYLKALTNSDASSYDAEPDLFTFNFNGYTGKFILDKNMNPVLLSHSNLKIEKDFNSAVWNFRVTTGDGVQYLFGGIAAREVTNKYQSGVGCGKAFVNPAVTAWYLNKVIHPNKDTLFLSYAPIAMNYKTGINQSQVYKVPNASVCKTCPTIANTTCINWLTTQGVILQEITSSSGEKVRFQYIDRFDFDDKLLSKIEILRADNSLVRAFNLEYKNSIGIYYTNIYTETSFSYRPFLIKLIERSPDSTVTKKHEFYYNKEDDLPPRLSFAQDHYGFFNGKNNGSLLTYGTESWLGNYFPQAKANRDPDPAFSTKGMLSKIVYPTGGEDTILYEGNTVYQRVEIPPPTRTVTAQASSRGLPSDPGETDNSDTVLISYKQDEIMLYGSVAAYGDDPIHNKGLITVYELPSGTAILNEVISEGSPISRLLYLKAGCSYFIRATAFGDKVVVGASFTCYVGQITYEYRNVNAGGIRIGEIISRSKSSPESVKKYNYSSLNTPGISSAGYIFQPRYYKTLTVKIPCQDPDAGLPGCSYADCQNYVLYSNPQNNIYIYPGAPIVYSSVIESSGENYEGGGIEHKYTVAQDIPGNILFGENILGAPLTNNGWKNGREIYQRVFRKENNAYVSVRETFTHYKDDSRVDTVFTAYIANKKFESICQGDPPLDDEFEAFDAMSYAYLRKWSYVDSVRILTYDSPGQNYVETLTVTDYSNPTHAMPTKVTSFLNDNKQETVSNYYANDLVLSGNEEIARQQMIERNMVASVILQNVARNATSTLAQKTSYYVSSDNLVLPQSLNVQIANNLMEKRIEFYRYNSTGKLLEQSKTGDVHEVYLWGYRNRYPVAKIVGTDYPTAAAFINPDILNNPSSDLQLRNELHKIRIGLSGTKALVTTYTYLPLVGMTSSTDANGQTTYYEYDNLGRLKLVKDKDGKILKQTDYQYQQPITQ